MKGNAREDCRLRLHPGLFLLLKQLAGEQEVQMCELLNKAIAMYLARQTSLTTLRKPGKVISAEEPIALRLNRLEDQLAGLIKEYSISEKGKADPIQSRVVRLEHVLTELQQQLGKSGNGGVASMA